VVRPADAIDPVQDGLAGSRQRQLQVVVDRPSAERIRSSCLLAAGPISVTGRPVGLCWTAKSQSSTDLPVPDNPESARSDAPPAPATPVPAARIALVQQALRKGRSLKLVADEVGYGSEAALSRAFKGLTGLSPREWKRMRAT
jgi:hypothetical protein